MKQGGIPLTFPETCRRRQIEPRNRRGRQLHDKGDGGPRFYRNAVNVEMVVILVAFGSEAERGGDIGDARRVEIRSGRAGADDVVALRGEELRDRFVGRVGEREDHPAWVRPGCLCRDRHATGHAVGACRGFDAELVAAPLVKLAQKGDVDLVVIGADDNGLHSARRPSENAQADEKRSQQKKQISTHSASTRMRRQLGRRD